MVSEVFNMDCVEYMRTLPDNHFDIAICDPPYGDAESGNFHLGGRFGGRFDRYKQPTAIPRRRQMESLQEATNCPPQSATTSRLESTHKAERGRQSTEDRQSRLRRQVQPLFWGVQTDSKLQRIDWDVAPPQEFFDELFRVSKNQIIWGGNYFSLPPTRCFLVWRKLSISEKFSMAMCEYAWTSFEGNAKLFEMTPQRGDNSGKFHPTEKPIALYNWVLGLFAKEGDRIFDPMMGSQSSRCAAYLSGYDFYGCEIDEYYFRKGNEFFERICHGVTVDDKGNKIIQQQLF